ncbi:hypothetical protein DLM76_07935 [Leptospira yasudae]|uniref:hypothetical protein n=1 Tax=Leptospira yasudae TaxID=2202201 RepID=UPI000E59B5E2|nr:hypothetical protein [Leptospira yasudae]RHX95232.1 hypothetical protein DLM76_07935 [Leptospira yasudae]
MKLSKNHTLVFFKTFIAVVLFVTVIQCSAGVARDRFVNETQCAEENVTVRKLGGGAFEVKGCNKKQTYVCIEAQWNTICQADPSL